MEILIREIKTSEYHLLKDFLYEAIFQRDENDLLPRDVVNNPKLSIYIENFGEPDDNCLVAELSGKIVGAVWTRILSGEIKGYGYVDDETPEFAISLLGEYRNRGIGTALMKSMLSLLEKKGYQQTSLAVQKDNYAVRMYKNVGFKISRKLEEEYLMICEFVE